MAPAQAKVDRLGKVEPVVVADFLTSSTDTVKSLQASVASLGERWKNAAMGLAVAGEEIESWPVGYGGW